MKRFVLAVSAALIVLIAEAQEAKEIVARYGKIEGNTFVSLDRKTFNLLKPMMKLDKETKQLLKILELSKMDMLQMKSGENVAKAEKEFKSLIESGVYKSAAREKKEEFEEGTDCLFKVDGDYVTDFVMYSRSPKDSSFVVMRIECNSKVENLKEFISLQPEEKGNQ